MANKKVVVTGVGVLCNLGRDHREVWGAAMDGKIIVDRIPERWKKFNDFKCQFWAPLPAIDYSSLGITKSDMLKSDMVTIHQQITATEALLNAGFEITSNPSVKDTFMIDGFLNHDRVGIYLGTAVGGMSSAFGNHSAIVLNKNKKTLSDQLNENQMAAINFDEWDSPRRVNPFTIPRLMPNAVSANLGIKFGLHGPNQVSGIACAAGGTAILNAYKAICSGDVDVAITGGSEYLNDEYGASFKGFDISGTLTQGTDPLTANNPFDESRSGFLFSEGGSATLILESYEHAIARGANIICSLSGVAESFDGMSLMQPDPDARQAERAILSALSQAGLTPQDIGYINTHGTGTVAGDVSESQLIKRIFAKETQVVSTKALTGHSIGASGAIEACLTALTLKHQASHGMPNLKNPICDINFVKGGSKVIARHGLTQSFAFGGHNIVLVFSAEENV